VLAHQTASIIFQVVSAVQTSPGEQLFQQSQRELPVCRRADHQLVPAHLTREDEQTVSTGREGPFRPNAYDSRPAATLTVR
jgi:hypothetical protein